MLLLPIIVSQGVKDGECLSISIIFYQLLSAWGHPDRAPLDGDKHNTGVLQYSIRQLFVSHDKQL